MKAFAVLLVLAASATSAHAVGTLKGKITAGTAPGDPVVDAVVMVEGVPWTAGAEPRHAVINQRNDTFVPHVVVVVVGTTVDFPNHDSHLHNVFSPAKGASHFDLGMYVEGETKSVKFDTPGVVPIRCNVHPAMDAYVVVHANPYGAVSDAHGEYTIAGVPDGSYTVRVWHERLAERSVPVVVRDGVVQPLDVHLDPPR
jgi:plastocyanin